MTPLLPFAAGLIVGAAAVTVIRSDATRKSLSRAGTVLRETGESGLAAVSRSAAALARPFGCADAAHEAEQAGAATEASAGEQTAADAGEAADARGTTPRGRRTRAAGGTSEAASEAAEATTTRRKAPSRARRSTGATRQRTAASEASGTPPDDDTGDSA